MANIKSAMKRIKVIEKKTLRNKIVKTSVKTAVKKFESAVAAGNLDEAKTLLSAAVCEIDKAASKGIIHKNAASRKKSRLSIALNKAAN